MVASAYRSYEEQRASHARLMSVYGADADGMSAAPGHSQHQLGTAVDFTNAAAGYQIWMPFAHDERLLVARASRLEYGFVLAYPRGKESRPATSGSHGITVTWEWKTRNDSKRAT